MLTPIPAPGSFMPRNNTPSLCGVGYSGLKRVVFIKPFTPFLHQNLHHMATFQRRGESWRVSVCIKGIRKSATRNTKAAAQQWARETESEIIAGGLGVIPDKTFADLLDRYVKDVSVNKKGYRWESVRIEALKGSTIGKVKLKDLDATDVVKWRDGRLKTVSGSTVVREKNLLCHACTIAIDEWKWLQKNPFHKVRMPKEARHRERLATEDDRKKLGQAATTDFYRSALRAWDFAVETGMRAGEICGLREIKGNVAVLEDTKNGARREVPLSAKAVELWNEGPLNLTPKVLDVNWRRLCKMASVEGLHFHDSRHLAATRLAQKLNLLELCKMFGWKDPRHAMIYFNQTAAEIAKKLDP